MEKLVHIKYRGKGGLVASDIYLRPSRILGCKVAKYASESHQRTYVIIYLLQNDSIRIEDDEQTCYEIIEDLVRQLEGKSNNNVYR